MSQKPSVTGMEGLRGMVQASQEGGVGGGRALASETTHLKVEKRYGQSAGISGCLTPC